jgi:hypothetical protein
MEKEITVAWSWNSSCAEPQLDKIGIDDIAPGKGV